MHGLQDEYDGTPAVLDVMRDTSKHCTVWQLLATASQPFREMDALKLGGYLEYENGHPIACKAADSMTHRCSMNMSPDKT